MKRNRRSLKPKQIIAKYTAKDSLFTDLFSRKHELLQLYQALHPEDNQTTESDIRQRKRLRRPLDIAWKMAYFWNI